MSTVPTSSSLFTRIVASGSALPRLVLSNHALADRLAANGLHTSDEWIRTRTGITQRHIASDEESTTSLGVAAARVALARAGIDPVEIGLIVVATSTPDQTFPSTACLIQRALGCPSAAAFDIQAACSGFVYALTVADSILKSGSARHALVIGAEVFSRLLDWHDRTTCVLFGDGAGAVVLSAGDQPGILASRLQADGNYSHILSANGSMAQGRICGDPFLRMEGQAVFKQAVAVLGQSAEAVLDEAGLSAAQIDWLIPHQANVRILQAVARKLNVAFEKVVVTLDRHGNTSAASVPLALDVAFNEGKIQAGQHILLQGVGGGFTWGSVLLRF
ncbi:MAG: beta-ketoacyl-ACP synthase III [Burkholderiaceae bacterium]